MKNRPIEELKEIYSGILEKWKGVKIDKMKPYERIDYESDRTLRKNIAKILDEKTDNRSKEYTNEC